MHLTKLILENFRNHEKLELNFKPDEPTFITGLNAQGKSNILEAIYLLALTKSFRTNHYQDLIKWNSEYGRIKGIFPKTELEIFLGNPPHPQKSFKKNGVKIGAIDFIGNLKIVFFHPEDLNMLYLGPDLRRRYLDILNIQINKSYLRALRSYKRILEQRNSLLKNIKDGILSQSSLEIWDEQLVEHGIILVLARQKTVQFLQKYLQDYYQKISSGKEKVTINYLNTLNDKAAYQTALSLARTEDLRAGFTTIGPHRDDLEFTLNGLTLQTNASRGEYRSLLLALKLLELKFFEENTEEKPLLLLDDVFSELDQNRQQMLSETIETHQTIITTTSFNRQHAAINPKFTHLTLEKTIK